MKRYQTLFINFDTVNTITIYHTSGAPLEAARRLCGRYEALFSRFQPGSDLWRINHALGAPVEVDEETAELIARSIAYTEATGGVFDITVGTLTGLWDFSGKQPPPAEASLQQAAGLVDSSRIQVEGRTVRVPAGVQLDLGGIAKGFIADKLAEFLRAEGVRSGMINLGGNILLLGGKPDGSPWKVGLQRPREDSCEWAATVEAEVVSVVTSGIYERGYDKHGARLHHVLNIKTGRPVESDLAAVSVICESSTDADAYSTAFLCMGSERTKKLLKQRPSFKVFLQKRDGTTEWCGT